MDVDTKLLRSFLSVATEGSFSRAAERLACSQGTMSLRIRALEDALGVELFDRGFRHVVLSHVGHELLPHAQALVDQHDTMLDRLRGGQVSGGVRLGFAEDYTQPILPRLLSRMQRSFPRIELSVTCALSVRLRQQVEARNLDLAIVTLPRRERRATMLHEPELVWVAVESFRPTPELPWPIAFYPEGCAFRDAAVRALETAGIAFREALTSSSGRVIQSAVESGTAISVMAEGTPPDKFIRLGQEVGLPPLPRTHIQILERDGGMTSAIHQVKALILQFF